jgi:hypothetical protein
MTMRLHILLLAVLMPCLIHAQDDNRKVVVSGSIQSDVLFPEEDMSIGAYKDDDKAKTNTYVDLKAQSQYVDAGARFEYLDHPLPGYENDFKGWGIRHYYLKGKLKNAELTLGSFYEQFGSGFILRTYEERALGIDNSLLGGRLVVRPVKGMTLKALSGVQRRYWHYNDALVSGADAEVYIDEWLPSLSEHDTRLMIGASWVNKKEDDGEVIFADPTHQLRLPEFVNAWDVRAQLNKGGWGLLAEYAQKTQDPSFDNTYIYKKGSAAMLSGSYSRKGMSALVQAKRSENMSFRSRRSMSGTSSFINHLPAFTLDHTYALAAIYPYATQLANGEWAFQGELSYTFPRKTLLGGKYGTTVKVNLSHVRSIDREEMPREEMPYGVPFGTDGYKSKFFKVGDDIYYQDINVQLSKKLSKSLKLNLMYMNQHYNMTVVEGEGGMVRSDIYIADALYQIAPKAKLRGEVQYLTTPDDQGDWAFALLELSLAPRWMFTVSDMWNCGVTDIHYYQGLVTFNTGAHRIQAGYGRTRAGYNCSGGVCRYVPATKGFTLSYNYNF